MTDLLIVVDMQRDFVSGALGSEQARAIVPAVAARIQSGQSGTIRRSSSPSIPMKTNYHEYPRGALSARAALHPQYARLGA